jgi:hypothetical protein
MRKLIFTVGIIVVGLLQGCATTVHRPSMAPQAMAVPLSSFANIELKPASIAPPFNTSGANRKATRKIDKCLNKELSGLFVNLNATDKKPGKTLVIQPQVKEIKFIGGFARFMVGTLAGNSAVLMAVSYQDKATGQIIAQPEFYNHANKVGAAWTLGRMDNLMLENVARQVVKYTKENR